MIIQKDILVKLKDFGLNTYEAKLWIALLEKGVATASELSDTTNVPRSRSYDVLETLEKKGFIVLKLGKPIKYVAVPPSEVIEHVKKNITEESQKQIQIIHEFYNTKTIQELNELHKSHVKNINFLELTNVIRGKKNILNYYTTLFKNAQKSISIITTEQGFLSKQNYFNYIFQKTLERGISIKIIVPKTKKTVQTAKLFEKNIQIKFSDINLLGRFCVIDSNSLHFFVQDEEHVDFCIGINTSFVAKSFENIFSALWLL